MEEESPGARLAHRIAVAAPGTAGAVASVPVAQALGYTGKLHWVSLEPPLIETFAIISRKTPEACHPEPRP